MSDKVSLPILAGGKFTGRALTHINELAESKVSALETRAFEAIDRKADQATFDTFLNTVTNQLSDSEARTALAGVQAAVGAERSAREDADARLAGRVSALEEAEPDLSGYATKDDLSQVAPTAEAVAKAMGFALVAGEVEPEPTRFGVPVVWLDTRAKRDPAARQPITPLFDIAKRTYTVPEDEGVEYLVDNALKAKGTYPVTPPAVVRIVARAKSGYTLAGTTEWSQEFEEQVSAYELAALAMQPEHYWRMDELSGVPKDRGTSPVNLYLAGGAEYSQPNIGVGATAIRSSMTKHAFQIGNHLPSGTAAYTMAAVVKGTGLIFQDWASKNRLVIIDSTKKLANAGPTTGWAKQTDIDPTQANHVAATWDGTTLKTYLNGVEVSSVADSGPVTQSAAFMIGREGLTFAGVVLDTKRAFTAEEIKKLSDAVVR